MMAEAAATAGLARMISLPVWPMRPTKLRLVVETARSPSARTPQKPPRARAAGRHGENRACVDEDIDQTFFQAVLDDLLRAGNDDAAHMIVNLVSLENLRGDAHVADAAVGAAAR